MQGRGARLPWGRWPCYSLTLTLDKFLSLFVPLFPHLSVKSNHCADFRDGADKAEIRRTGKARGEHGARRRVSSE